MASSRSVLLCAVGVALVWTAGARASEKPSYGPPPSWVQLAATPETAAPDGSPASQLLLDDNQSRLGPTGDTFYNRRVVKVLKTEGLANFTSQTFTWDPDTEDLTIHQIAIHRDGKVIDLLNGGDRVLVLRRETGLELGMLDGRLTATRQIEGLQVGDVLDVSWTQTRHDPATIGHSEDPEGFSRADPTGRYRLRISWPAAYPVKWRAGEGFGQPALSTAAGRTELTLDRTDAKPPDPPLGAPPRYFWLGRLEASSYASWPEVSRLIAPLFEKAATLKPGSPLKAEAAAIAARSADPKVRAFEALRLVEDKVRYFFVGTDDGGYVPADADVTWRRTFGDCKGKTVVLLALLKELGVKAEPALVSTVNGDGMDQALPGLQRFNHVIVRASIGGRVYWLDGTRSGDIGGADSLAAPPWRWALPLNAQGAELERIVQPPMDQPAMSFVMHVDGSKGLDGPAPMQMQIVYHGDMAIGLRTMAAMRTKDDLQKAALRSFARTLYWIQPKAIAWKDDPAGNNFELDFTGVADLDWRDNDDLHLKEFVLQGGATGSTAFPQRDAGSAQDAPFAVAFPMYITSRIEVALPGGGAGYSVRGVNVDQTLGGYEIKRSAVLDGGVARFLGSMKSLAPETTATEAQSANKQMRRFMQTQDVIRRPIEAPAESKAATAAAAG
jgi:transglutaminase-like putative cysteine protease